MLTDVPPRNSNLAGFQESDRLTTLDLPDDASLPETAGWRLAIWLCD